MKTAKSAFFFVVVFLFLIVLYSNSQTITTGNPTQSCTVGELVVTLVSGVTATGIGIAAASVSIQEYVSGEVLNVTPIAGYSESWNNSTKVLTITTP